MDYSTFIKTYYVAIMVLVLGMSYFVIRYAPMDVMFGIFITLIAYAIIFKYGRDD